MVPGRAPRPPTAAAWERPSEAEAAAPQAAARPTAVNLAWAVERVLQACSAEPDPVAPGRPAPGRPPPPSPRRRPKTAAASALHGLPHHRSAQPRAKRGRTVNVLTHCNAGWLACVEYGTATAPIYAAFDRGIDLHVWVDETRPLNQGARLTAWELARARRPAHGDHRQRRRPPDAARAWWTSSSSAATAPRPRGDVANKIGTYLKALAAQRQRRPVLCRAALEHLRLEPARRGAPTSPSRSATPTRCAACRAGTANGRRRVRICPEKSPAANFAFDVTPARLVTGLITERGRLPGDRGGHPEIVSGQESSVIEVSECLRCMRTDTAGNSDHHTPNTQTPEHPRLDPLC
ncbi:MAG: S-methyl-5-thioribose-1-phosphate isomerase [Desulfobacterales bacterium]|nr:S-methyl-5-thioribose-1-phosphate isomerase [Desulfobacterales bacterium]